jgi:NADH:ubiquinone oxidoreductase subunit E
MPLNSPATFELQILPALRSIQEERGYLDPVELKQFSKESGVHLYRLQEVASFFPHFHLEPPPPITVKVCRDMACHMAGSAELIEELRASATAGTCAVEGVSCVGRCDRAPAVCLAVRKQPAQHQANANGSAFSSEPHEREFYLLGRSGAELKRIIADAEKRKIPEHSDQDLDQKERYPDRS